MRPYRQQSGAVIEAEGALQTVSVLRHMRALFEGGHWARGHRHTVKGDACLIGALDQASAWTIPGVAEEVTRELVRGLPGPLRVTARVAPRTTLMVYNDWPGGRRRANELVEGALGRLGVPTSTSTGFSPSAPQEVPPSGPGEQPPSAPREELRRHARRTD